MHGERRLSGAEPIFSLPMELQPNGRVFNLPEEHSPCFYQPIAPEVTVLQVPPPPPTEWQPLLIKEKERDPHKTNWCGVLLAFMSGAFFTLSSAAVKALRSVDPMELLVIRSVLQVLVMLAIVVHRGDNPLGMKGYRWLLQLQGVVGGVTLVLLFYSFRRLPLGDATTIIFSSPVVVMILSFLFLKEPCGFFRTLVIFMLITGVILISKPPFLFHIDSEHSYDMVGYACAITATLFTALNMVVMRKCKDVHFAVVVFQLSAWSLLVASILLATLGHHHNLAHHNWFEWGMAVVVSILGLSGQVLVAQALGMEGAGKVAVTRSLDIVLAFVLQVFAFGEIPDWMSILGASLVLVCVLGMGLESQVQYLAGLVP
ncbi:solute carrier family 35 member G1 [Anabrus simplex]|uniref:solute carrier family 35 member G1 n=1 Tax=Anabrus simplex TaxID=316456 RepID=UPI0035A357B8